VDNKETDAPAWVTVVGHGAPAVPAEPPEPEPATAAASVTNNFTGINMPWSDVTVRGDMVQQKNVYGERERPES
jgi:hypothetical protein